MRNDRVLLDRQAMRMPQRIRQQSLFLYTIIFRHIYNIATPSTCYNQVELDKLLERIDQKR